MYQMYKHNLDLLQRGRSVIFYCDVCERIEIVKFLFSVVAHYEF
jgi:hypothetical protein